MDPNIGGDLIQKGPQWAFEADFRVKEYDKYDYTKFRLPPEPVSSFVFHWSLMAGFPIGHEYLLLLQDLLWFNRFHCSVSNIDSLSH